MKRLLIILLSTLSIQVQAYTGEDFIEGITSDDTSLNSGAYGYLMGVIAIMTDKGIEGRCVTLPKGADLMGSTEIVFGYIKENANQGGLPAWVLIETALGEAHGFHEPKKNGWCW